MISVSISQTVFFQTIFVHPVIFQTIFYKHTLLTHRLSFEKTCALVVGTRDQASITFPYCTVGAANRQSLVVNCYRAPVVQAMCNRRLP